MVTVWAPPLAAGETNPTLVEEVSAVWPQDPVAERRADVEAGAALVRAALAGLSADATTTGDVSPGGEAGPQAQAWATEARLLIEERARQRVGEIIDVSLPEHLSVSQLVALRRDPQRLAHRLRRPLPEAPETPEAPDATMRLATSSPDGPGISRSRTTMS